MSSQTIDFSDLGGKRKLDFSDLGGKPKESVSVDVKYGPPVSDTNTIGQGIYDVTIGPIRDILAHQEQNVKDYGPFWATFKTGWDIAKGLVKASNDEGVKALQELGKGDFGEFIRHAPGVIPGIGPAAVQASEQMKQGNVNRGVGQAVGLIGTSVIGSKAKPVLQEVRSGLTKAAGRMYESALKPSPSGYSPAERSAMVETGLREGIPVSEGGQKKIYGLIDQLNKEREGIVEGAPKPEATITPKEQRARLTAGPREMPPIPPEPGTTQTAIGQPVIETTFSAQSQQVPRGLLTPGGTPRGSGRFVVEVEKGKRKPLPIVTKPNVLPGLTAEEVIEQANVRRGYSSSIKEPVARTTESGPYNPPTTSTTVISKESVTAQNRNAAQVSSQLENAKNAQLIEIIEKRARETGLLEAVQDAARAAGKPIPTKFSDVFDVQLKNVIYPKDVATRIDQIVDRYRSVNPEADLAALQAAKDEFLRNYPNPLSIKQAQKLKSTTYSVIGERPYSDKAGKPAGATAGEQALARGLMEEIGEQIPEVKRVNARESKLFGVLPALNSAVGRIRNWELFSPGLYGATAATATGVATGSIEATAAVTAIITLLRNPNVKSRLAIAMSKAGSRVGKPLTVSGAKAILDSYAERLAVANISLAGASRPQQQSEPTR